MGKCSQSTASFLTAMGAFHTDNYPLHRSAILDSGTTLHIFNDLCRFLNFRKATPGDFIWAGDSTVEVLGYGEVQVRLQTPEGSFLFTLKDVAFCPRFACNIISYRRLKRSGIWLDNSPGNDCLRQRDGSLFCTLQDLHQQSVMEVIPENFPKSSFFSRRNKYNSWTRRKTEPLEAMIWHRRMGHIGPAALEHLVEQATGVRIKGVPTIKCEACNLSKIKRKVSRRPREHNEGPGMRIAIDFHPWEKGIKNFRTLLLLTERWSSYSWGYYLTDQQTETQSLFSKTFLGYWKGSTG